MALILRESKGSPLTFAEMDGNLTFLQSIADGGGSSYYNNGNSSQNTVIDWSRANLQKIAIDNDPTLSFTGAEAGQKLTLLLSREVGESRVIIWSDGIFWKDSKVFDLKKVLNGGLDESFVIGNGFNGDVYTISIQPDGKILVGGIFTDFDSNTANYLARLNADGSLDTSFAIGSGFNGPVYAISIQPDGKILVGGTFTDFDGNAVNYLARLNADGTLDGGFDMSTGFNGQVNSIFIQPDGKILIGGAFTDFDGNAVNYLARLNADGTFGFGFNGFSGGVLSISLQPDGKILVGGNFTDFDGNTVNYLARLNADGTLDGGFDMSTGFNGPVYAISIQPDGKILVGGTFTDFDGNAVNYLARLNADGTLDGGFDMSTGFNGQANSISLQPDGKILVGGQFTDFDSNQANYLARLNADGSLDTSFAIGSGFNGPVYAIALQSDSRILVGGGFTDFDMTSISRLARLDNSIGDIYTPVNIYYTGDEYIGDY